MHRARRDMLARHSLVWLTPAGWQRTLASLAEADRQAAQAWRDHDWPGVARRSEAEARPGEVAIGLPLPPVAMQEEVERSGRRLRCIAVETDIRMVRGAVSLEIAASAAPAGWQPSVCRLVEAMRVENIALDVFGSLAFQHLTGQRYLRTGSDIDVLLRPASPAQLQTGIDLLDRFARVLPLDGEAVFPDGHAVAWKEWARARRGTGRAPRLLAKRADGVRLLSSQQLLGSFETFHEDTPC